MLLRKMLRFLPRNPLGRALGAFNRGDFASAASLFEEAFANETQPAADVLAAAGEAWSEVSRGRESQGDVAGALSALDRAATLCPSFADLQVRLGRLHESLDQPQHARNAYLRALDLNPRYFEARLSLARLLAHLEDTSGALQHLQEARRGGPPEAVPILHALENDLSTRQAQSRIDAAFERLLDGPSSPVQAGLAAARAALREGDNARAIAALKNLLTTHANFPDLHDLLGVAYDNEEMTDDAIEEFEAALRLNPRFTDAQLHLGLALYERGRETEAQRHLRAVASHGEGNEVARAVLAQIEARSAVR